MKSVKARIIVKCLLNLIFAIFILSYAQSASPADKAELHTVASSLPLSFTQNNGQWPDSILFRAYTSVATESKNRISTPRPSPVLFRPDSEIDQNPLLKTLSDGKSYVCGDATGNGLVDLLDALYILDYIFFDSSAPSDYLAANADGCSGPDTAVNISDARLILAYVFEGGISPSNCAETGEAWASPSGYEVRVAAPPYTPYPGGDSVAIPIYITNASSIQAITAGFHYTSPEGYKITSVDWTGTVFMPNVYIAAKFDTLQSLALVGGTYSGMSMSPQDDGLLVKLNARAIGMGGTGNITIEKAFVPPAGDFIFVSSGLMIVPAMSYPLEVTILDDAGAGSLRDAIIDANTNSGIDTIIFSVFGTIALSSSLPAIIDDSTVILGSTAPGGAHSVIIDGSALPGGSGFVVQSRHNKIEGLTIRNFPQNGIEVVGASTAYNTITSNLIYGNGETGIDLGNDGVTPNDLDDTDTGPNDLLNYPTIDSVHMNPDSSFAVWGKAIDSAIIEFFVAHPANDGSKPEDPTGHGEAYSYIGRDTCNTAGAFAYNIPNTISQFSMITMTATDTLGNTSEFSQNFGLIPAPLIVVAYSPVNLKVTDPNGYFIGKDANGNLTKTIMNATYDEIINDSVTIPNPILGHYIIEIIPESDAPPGSTYGVGIRIDGSVQSYMVWNAAVPASGTVDTVFYSVEEGFPFVNGDPSDNGAVNILDVTFLISYLYKNGPAPYPLTAGDANCNSRINILDATYIISFLFKGGPPPCQAPPK